LGAFLAVAIGLGASARASTYGTYFVTGNHEYHAGSNELAYRAGVRSPTARRRRQCLGGAFNNTTAGLSATLMYPARKAASYCTVSTEIGFTLPYRT
jgi:hypothetical protein